MASDAQAMFAVKSWDEKTWDGRTAAEVSGEKQTRALVTYTYHGDIEGESELQYLMTYFADGTTGAFVGMERVRGILGGRTGSFVLEHTGSFDAQGVRGSVRVVPGSGTGELASIRGEGSVHLAGQQAEYPLRLSYELP